MRKLKLILCLLLTVTALALPQAALACPSCQEAPTASSGADDDQNTGNPAAYNQSIYIMVGVPYFTFGILGFFVYRGMKKNEAFQRVHGQSPQA